MKVDRLIVLSFVLLFFSRFNQVALSPEGLTRSIQHFPCPTFSRSPLFPNPDKGTPKIGRAHH